MLNTIYANRCRKKDVTADAIVYWFRDYKNRLVGIVSFGTMSLSYTVVLYTANSRRFVSFLDKDEPTNTKNAIFYMCD